MARTKYAAHVGGNVRRDGVMSRDEYLLSASTHAARGVDLPQSKLMPLDIGEIRSASRQRENMRKYISENLSNAALAKKFGTHVRNIEKVLSYEAWGHLP
jgi:hypothetical protein